MRPAPASARKSSRKGGGARRGAPRTEGRGQRRRAGQGWAKAGFTLFEILVVLAILSIVASIGVPAVLQSVKKTPMRQAVSDLEEACRNARMLAILQDTTTELIIRAGDGTLAVQNAAAAPEPSRDDVEAGEESFEPSEAVAAPRPAVEVKPFTAKIPSTIAFKKLVVNLQDMMDAVEARVRFYPNGTCDAFTTHLVSEQNEERTITLEITTGREIVEVLR